jgi:hypothetical protein
MQTTNPSVLSYAPSQGRQKAWGLVGFGLALTSLAGPLLLAWILWRGKRSGASFVSVGVNPLYYALPLAGIALLITGFRGRGKLVPTLGIVVALTAAAATTLICSRSW